MAAGELFPVLGDLFQFFVPFMHCKKSRGTFAGAQGEPGLCWGQKVVLPGLYSTVALLVVRKAVQPRIAFSGANRAGRFLGRRCIGGF